METADQIVALLADHVFGANAPDDSLLSAGTFPTGWIAEYLRLVRLAREEWAHKPSWPKQLVSAVHFASWYLPLRYEVWSQKGLRRNPETEEGLSSLREPSEIFLMSGSVK